MEFTYLIENGEFFVEDAEVQRLMEETGLSEEEIMDAIAEVISEADTVVDIDSKDYKVKDGNSTSQNNGQMSKPEVVDGTFREIPNTSNTNTNTPTPSVEKQGFIKRNLDKASTKWQGMSKGKKIGVGVGALAAGAAIGAGVAAYKRHKAKKEAERRAMLRQECAITVYDDSYIMIDEATMDFLLETFDYELSESEILCNAYEVLLAEGKITDSVASSFNNLVGKFNKAKEKLEKNPDDKEAAKEVKGLGAKIEAFKADPEKMAKLKKGGKIAAGVALGAAAIGGGYAAYNAYKNKKDAENLYECMIDFEIDYIDDTIAISESDMDFLLEACDYALSAEEIVANILAEETDFIAGKDGVKDVRVKKEEKKETPNQDRNTINVAPNGKASYANSSVPAVSNKQQPQQKFDIVPVGNNLPAPVNPKGGSFNKDNVVATYDSNPSTEVKTPESTGTGVANKPGIMSRIKGMSKGKKIAAGAVLGAAALGGAAAITAAAIKKRKAKKEQEAAARNLKECMIDLVQEGEYIFISESDMDFLLEACNYALTETEILTNIAESKEVDEYFPGDGIVAVTSDKTMAKIQARQAVDMEEDADDNGMMADVSLAPETKEKLAEADDLLDESEDLIAECEELLSEGECEKATKKLNKTKSKLDKAERTRKELDNMQVVNYGTSNRLVASKMRASKDRQDKRVAKLKDKVAKAEKELKQAKKVSEGVEMNYELDDLISEGLEFMTQADEILDEAFDLLEESQQLLEAKSIERAERKLRKAEAKLKQAQDVREQIDRVEKVKIRRENSGKGPFLGLGTGMYNTSTARSINRGRDRQDRRIEKAKEKVAKAKAALEILKSEGYIPANYKISESTYELDMYEDIISEAMDALFNTDDIISEAEELLDEVLTESEAFLTEDAIEKAKRKVAKAEKKLERAKRDKETMIDLEDRKLRREKSAKGPFLGLGTGMYNTSVARSVVRGRNRQDKRIAKAEEKLARAKAALKQLQPKSESYDYYSETFEGDHLINEAILADNNISLTEGELFDLVSENILSERSIVRLDKAAKRSQAEAKALVVIAREQNDPLYKKLVKCYKQKQAILAQLDSKYGSRAIARVRKNAGKMNVDDK